MASLLSRMAPSFMIGTRKSVLGGESWKSRVPATSLVQTRLPAAVNFFFFNDTPPTEIYPFSLRAALPISTRGLRYVGVVLLCLAFILLATPAVLEYHRRTETPIWNWYLYAYGITIACLFAGAWLFRPPRTATFERTASTLLNSLGAILTFLLLNIEIADYFSIGPTLTFSFSGNFARDMTYSIAWALCAFVLLVVGVVRHVRALRLVAIGLLCLALAKLFLHDLNTLNQLYRIGAF